jgi:integrase
MENGVRRMARAMSRLKAIQVSKASKPGMLADGGGLYLRISPSGAKSWVFRFRRDGKLHDMGLGPVHTITLAEARAKAVECRKLRLDGKDPLAEKRATRAQERLAAASAVTFKECAERYIETHRAGWRDETYAPQWESSLAAYIFPVFGDLPVQAIDVGLVMKAIEPIWMTRTATAARVRARIESVLDWAATSGYRQGENPARWRGHLENLLPSRSKVQRVEHHAALPYAEVGAFLVALRQQDGIPAHALEFVILTAARAGEVAGARWDEINTAERLWTIPAERMKSGHEHRVPLSNAAMAIVEKMAALRKSDFVFPGRKASASITIDSFWQLVRRMGRGADLTIHGFRSSFRDWAAERTEFPSEIAEMALAHTVGGAVERAYRRSDMFDKRRQIMDLWARFCAAPWASGKILPLREAI